MRKSSILVVKLFVQFGSGDTMSKIGRRPITLGNVNVQIDGQKIQFKGAHAAGEYVLPIELLAKIENNALHLELNEKNNVKMTLRDQNRVWGLHRALLFNKISGAQKPFEKKIVITGLGYKAVLAGKKLTFSLGYSHKIDFELPEGISVEVDKSGQKLTVKSPDKFLAGQVSSDICALRKTEPYKGTGIKLEETVIIRKAGKAKS